MTFQFNAYAVTLLLSGVAILIFGLCLFDWSKRAVRWFPVMMQLTALWAIAYALELASSSLEAMLFWIRIEYVGISFVPAAWLMFVLRYVGRESQLGLRARLLIFGFPCLTLLAVWTNSWHHLHYRSVGVDASGPFPLLALQPGPWYAIHTLSIYTLLGYGLYLLADRFRHADGVYRRQNLAILVGALIPWGSNLAYLLGFKLHRHIDLTPFAFLVTSMVVGWALFRFKLFDLVPSARERVIEGIQEGMLVLDQKGRAVDVNARMRDLLGPAGGTCIGRPIAALMPEKGELLARIADDKEGRLETDIQRGSEILSLEVAITPLWDWRERRSGTLLIFWDITERKAAARQLEAQAVELRGLNQMKSRILSIIAHDLRSPLAGLTSMLEIADAGMLSEEEFRELIPMISRSVDDASALLENLLTWSLGQLDGQLIRRERFDLSILAGADLPPFEKKASDKGVQLVNRLTEGAWVDADRNMISLVVRNLVGNAVKFCRRDDRITLETRAHEGALILTVTDTGVGMKPEVLRQLFGFDLVSQLGTEQERGTGRGLKLCHDFVLKNGGEIWAESELGKGSRFHVRLKSGL